MCLSSLRQRELTHIDEPPAEALRTPRQVVHEVVVDLFGLQRDGALPVGLQVGRPGVQGLCVVQLQQLGLLQVEPNCCSCTTQRPWTPGRPTWSPTGSAPSRCSPNRSTTTSCTT